MLQKNLLAFLQDEIVARLSHSEKNWVVSAQQKIQTGDARTFCLLYSQVSRYINKNPLAYLKLPKWEVKHWSYDQAIRTVFLLSWTINREFKPLFQHLVQYGDIRELIALYQSLALMPGPELLSDNVSDGLRTNMQSVFNAIALNNPYPMQYFSDPQWNQMILKAIFMGSAVQEIMGIQRRKNPELTNMLNDFAKERRAASRVVPSDINILLGE